MAEEENGGAGGGGGGGGGGEFDLRYYVGHKGRFDHELLEFEFRPDGKLRYANNSNYKNDTMIRKEVFLTPSVLKECRRIVSDSEGPSISGARHARLHICTSFVRLAKTADTSLLPHMKGIADTVSYLQKEGQLLRGEHNLFGETFLIMASAAGSQQQQEVMTCLLEPLSHQWTQLEWQNAYLSDPAGLIKLCGETQFMWSLCHTVTFFNKALKRSGIKNSSVNTNSSTASSVPHPLASHLPWMLPPLLKLLDMIVADGADNVGILMDVKREILVNLNEAASTIEPPEDWEGMVPDQLLLQLASAWDIDLQQLEK